ncbi:phage envelope protein [Sphingobacteriaceae bacterium]|nr:phage envelope protein [Sphingobacteriaceae bacterium]
MFTQDQITKIHERFGKKDSLVAYLKALKEIGVEKEESFVADGHSEYHGQNHKVASPALHEKLPISKEVNHEEFLKHLSLHNEGKTSYLAMSNGLAGSGIEKWSFDTTKMTLTYYDLDGNELLVEDLH